jgi:tetratricopeptide (TPR) repeat protein
VPGRLVRYAEIASATLVAVTMSANHGFGAVCPDGAATVVSVQGTVEAKRAAEETWVGARLGDIYCPGDTVRVAAQSRADLALANQSVLRLREGTTLVVQGAKSDSSYAVDLMKGAAHFFSRQGARQLEVNTPFTVAGVRGTEFAVDVEADQAVVRVFEGRVIASGPAGSLALTDGQAAVAESGKPPTMKVEARPRDAVRWTLYYPPVVYRPARESGRVTAVDQAIDRSMEASRRGDLTPALEALAPIDAASVQEPGFFTYRASLLLAIGAVDRAEADLTRALELRPNDADALALQTVIALAGNEKDDGLALAERAVAANPRAASAAIALSYARQARFDLTGARDAAQQAVTLAPEDALAWARLAELHSSSGELRAATEAADRAATLDPNLARTHTVRGFALLTEVKTAAAAEAFGRAIQLDSADPLPRLGLGLAKVRDGQLDAGARDLEVAASLDPSNALVRSYLGKIYYEEKRTGLDTREYAMAKQLDPLDPTPWFYDAITKQTTNRPVEALRDFQKAIELNDNRAVYRSRLLLDSDLAARSASLGRIYGDLGFQPLALVEGWKSVNVDPTNYSAHRFLADSYSVLPRHQIARVSELLQSQLLQPINVTPIQPRLAESNLFQVSSGGPTALAFNEFNSLFNRDRVTLQTTGVTGSNDTYAGEGIVAGVYKRASFSVGYDHFTSDGFRPNNDQRDDIVDAFFQAEVTPQSSLQAEYRYRNREQGDLQLRFFRDDYRPNERQSVATHTYRVGGKHAFGPDHIVLASFIHQEFDDTLHDEPGFPVTSLDVRGDLHSDAGETQYLFRSRWVNLVSGVGHFEVGGTDRFVTELMLEELIRDEQENDRDLQHTNVYSYAYIEPLPSLTVTLGGSGDFFSGDSATKERNQFNPKVGVTWTPWSKTTLRAAGFRALKRTLITDQTLEPTQVAGFNQFFDDGNGTSSWRYGGAIDHKFTDRLFGGSEYSERDLNVPFEFVQPESGTTSVEEADWHERLARMYLFWAPHDWVALRLEYSYERYKRESEFTFGVKEMDTHRVPMGVSVFHPTGFSASFTGTYVNQEGTFEPNPEEFRSGDSDFYLVDAMLGYRLPQRFGFVSVGVTNLFEEHFQYHDIDFSNPTFQPDRVVYGKVTLAFP